MARRSTAPSLWLPGFDPDDPEPPTVPEPAAPIVVPTVEAALAGAIKIAAVETPEPTLAARASWRTSSQIVEAGPRILAGLPDYLAEATLETLRELEVSVLCNERVVAVEANALVTADGKRVPADFTVWAAGIKCADVLSDLDGLESNRLNQLVVTPTLQTTRDANVFALGDCAACAWVDGRNVPPRAQSAHQQANHMVNVIRRRLAGKPPIAFRYRDFGSLVSLGNYQSVGTLMGFVARGSVRVEGLVAKMFYISLYKLHLWALHGFWRMALDTLARMIKSQTEPRVKLH